MIALCGNPTSGKTEVQRILNEKFGYAPVDDGMVLRKFCVENLGLSWDDVMTQEGKKRFTELLGRRWQNREILGELGAALEKLLGEHIMPLIAYSKVGLGSRACFGSIRKTQGHFFRERGALVIGIRRPGVGPSPYDFDKFDESAVHLWIDNSGTIADLERMVGDVLRYGSSVIGVANDDVLTIPTGAIVNTRSA